MGGDGELAASLYSSPFRVLFSLYWQRLSVLIGSWLQFSNIPVPVSYLDHSYTMCFRLPPTPLSYEFSEYNKREIVLSSNYLFHGSFNFYILYFPRVGSQSTTSASLIRG